MYFTILDYDGVSQGKLLFAKYLKIYLSTILLIPIEKKSPIEDASVYLFIPNRMKINI